MNKFAKLLATSLTCLSLINCGGGGEEGTKVVNELITVQSLGYNDAWDKALVFKPYDPNPVRLKDLGYFPKSPVAISMHGCAGIHPNPTAEGENYFPIFLAMQGYLVIEPNSYYGLNPGKGSLLCYQVNGQWLIPNLNLSGTSRALDLEYAIAMVKNSSFWDGKTLLVEGNSQGYFLTNFLNDSKTIGPTKWLLSGYGTCKTDYRFTHNNPTLIINSKNSPWNDVVPQECYDQITKVNPNIKIEVLEGDKHTPIQDPIGYKIIKDWVRLK